MDNYSIIGFGSAGYHAVRALRRAGFEGNIRVFSDTPNPPANPILTTYYASGKIAFDRQFVFGDKEKICREFNLDWHANIPVSQLDAEAKLITLADGSSFAYDKALVATGCAPIRLPVGEGCEDSVFYMRRVEDGVRLRERLEKGQLKNALVVGASMVGTKVVEVLTGGGCHCLLNDGMSGAFPMAALPETARIIQEKLTALGVEQKYGTGVAKIESRDGGILSTFQDGEEYWSDIIVICVGLRANLSFINREQISCGRGILVDEYMQSSVPDTYAAGDCAEIYNLQTGQRQMIGLWANAADQGTAAGTNMAGGRAPYAGSIASSITHFMGMDFVSFGMNNAGGEREMCRLADGETTVEYTFQDDKLQCVNILSDIRQSGVARARFIKSLTSGSDILDPRTLGLLTRSGFSEALINCIARGGKND